MTDYEPLDAAGRAAWEQGHAEALDILRNLDLGQPFFVAVASPDPVGIRASVEGDNYWLRRVRACAQTLTEIVERT